MSGVCETGVRWVSLRMFKNACQQGSQGVETLKLEPFSSPWHSGWMNREGAFVKKRIDYPP